MVVYGVEQSISQFADDTALYITSNKGDVRTSMKIFEEFHILSEVKINLDKTNVMNFGLSEDGKTTFCTVLEILWTNRFTSL